LQITRNSRKINLSATGETVALNETCAKPKIEQPRLAKRRVLDPLAAGEGREREKANDSFRDSARD